jgi:hypothetical protein
MLAETAILALIVNPSCGAVRLPEQADLARHLVATALQESGGDPLAIGVNADPIRHLPADRVQSSTAAEAATKARSLLEKSRSIDLGLFQISDRQLPRHHLAIETAFDPCRNTAAAAHHLANDFRVAAWDLSHRLYNCGRVDCSEAYAQAVTARVGAAPDDPSLPPPGCPPGDGDGWHTVARPTGCPDSTPETETDEHEDK